MLIPFKKSDFKKADYYNSFDCPIYRACKRELGNPEGLIVGGKTIRIAGQRFMIGQVRMNASEDNPRGSLMTPGFLGTMTLNNIHLAIRFKSFKNASVELIPMP